MARKNRKEDPMHWQIAAGCTVGLGVIAVNGFCVWPAVFFSVEVGSDSKHQSR
jgi:hypothetical protein